MTHPWTAEPWELKRTVKCFSTGALPIETAEIWVGDGAAMLASFNSCADGERVYACVNALAGIPDPTKLVTNWRECVEALNATEKFIRQWTGTVPDSPVNELLTTIHHAQAHAQEVR